MIRSQLARNHVQTLIGTGRFADPHTVVVTADDGTERRVTAEKFVVAVGTRPARPTTVDFDGRTVVDSDQILDMDHLPPSMVVVGAGVIGIEYASMFAALGTKVTVVERRDRMLEFCDLEIIEALKYQLRDLAVTFRFRESVTRVERHEGGDADHPGERQAHPGRHGDVLGRPAGRHREPRPGEGRPRGRRARPDQGGRRLPDHRRAHLRGRRRDRLPRAGRDVDGAGPAGGLPRLRRAGRRRR